jgi:hypothetical protein
MATKITRIFAYIVYGIYVLFLGEITMIKYSKSLYQMILNNAEESPKPENFILFNLIMLSFQHVFALAVNITVITLTIKYAFY